jgi:hypothetical protein
MPPKADHVSFEVQWRPANEMSLPGWRSIRDPVIKPASLYARGYAENAEVLVLDAGACDIDIRPASEYVFRVNATSARGRAEGMHACAVSLFRMACLCVIYHSFNVSGICAYHSQCRHA